MLDKIKQLSAEIAGFQAKSLEEVEQFRIKHLSKKGTIAALFDDFKTVPADQKKAMGQELNELKNTALAKINELKELLSNAEEDLSGIDLTMPGDPLKLGTRHPLAIVKNEILAIFNKLGFTISEGPEIKDDWHNFSASVSYTHLGNIILAIFVKRLRIELHPFPVKNNFLPAIPIIRRCV